MANKFLLIGGTITAAGLVLLYFYYKSRATVAKGVNYDLEGADIYALSNTPTTPTATGTATPAPRYAVDSYTEPAASLIARQMEAFLLSANTMNRIKTRIGWNSNLFQGLTQTQTDKIKNAFVQKFDINPNSLLSYPLWLPNEKPELLPQLQSRLLLSWQQMRATQKVDFLKVSAWAIDFAAYGFNPYDVNDYNAARLFFTNAVRNIKQLNDAVRYEAVQYLRNTGWRFTDYGDVNN